MTQAEVRYVLESEFDDFKAEYRRDAKELTAKLDSLVTQVSGVGKTSTKEWLLFVAGVGGFAMVIIAGLWTMAIAPIAQRQESNVSAIRDVEQQNIRNASNLGKVVESLKEVETQFESKYVISNLETMRSDTLLNILWQEVFPDKQLPTRTYWPQPQSARGPTLNGH